MKLKEQLADTFAKTKDALGKASPEILIVAGVVGLVGATVLAIKATKKAEKSDRILDIKDEIGDLATTETITDGNGNDVPVKVGQRKAYLRLAGEYAKFYAPTILVTVASIVMIFTGTGIIKNRLHLTASALAVTEQMLEQYRANVVEKYGEEEDKNLYNGFKTQVLSGTDEDGAEHQEAVKTSKMADISPLSVFWGPDYNRFVPKNHTLALAQLQGIEKDMQCRIEPRNGKVYIRDILIQLGYEDDYVNGNPLYALYGYEHGDVVNFGLYDGVVPGNADFVMGRTDTCLINFNGAHRLIDFV